jgi:TIR domain/HEAT repeats
MHSTSTSHVFLSYARDSLAEAINIKQQMAAHGHTLWVDLHQLRGGSAWRSEIDEAIASSRAVVVLKSPASDSSKYVIYEWSFALGLGLPVLPIDLGSTAAHPHLQSLHHLAYKSEDASFWERLKTELGVLSDPLVPWIRENRTRLLSPFPEDRTAALEKLISIEHPKAMAAAMSQLGSADPLRRLEAAEALAMKNEPAAFDAMFELLSTSRAENRNEIIRILARLDIAIFLNRMVDNVCATGDSHLRHQYCLTLAEDRSRSENALGRMIPSGDKPRDEVIHRFLLEIASIPM